MPGCVADESAGDSGNDAENRHRDRDHEAGDLKHRFRSRWSTRRRCVFNAWQEGDGDCRAQCGEQKGSQGEEDQKGPRLDSGVGRFMGERIETVQRRSKDRRGNQERQGDRSGPKNHDGSVEYGPVNVQPEEGGPLVRHIHPGQSKEPGAGYPGETDEARSVGRLIQKSNSEAHHIVYRTDSGRRRRNCHGNMEKVNPARIGGQAQQRRNPLNTGSDDSGEDGTRPPCEQGRTKARISDRPSPTLTLGSCRFASLQRIRMSCRP